MRRKKPTKKTITAKTSVINLRWIDQFLTTEAGYDYTRSSLVDHAITQFREFIQQQEEQEKS